MECGLKAGLPSLWASCFTCVTTINGAHLLLLVIVKLVLGDVHVLVIVLRFYI
jgi:hypothetical protein